MQDKNFEEILPAVDQAAPAEDAEPQVDPLLEELRARLPEGYELVGNMIHRLRSAGRALPLCGPVLVRSQARGADGSGWTLDVVFRAFDGGWQAAVLPMRDLLKAPGRVVADLVDRGLDLRGRPQEVCDLLRAMEVDRVSLAVGVTGWVGEGYDTFILPSGQIITGSTGADAHRVLFTGTPRVAATPVQDDLRAALAERWGRGVVGDLPDDPVLLGLCAAITPVLLPITGSPSFLLHLHGNDGVGRLSRAVAASVWAQSGELHLTWSDPLPRILAEIGAARDSLVLLAGYEPRHHRKLPAIAEALGGIDAAGPGRVVVLSTGTVPLLGGDGKAPAGQDLRNIIDIDTRPWVVDDPERVLAAAAQYAGTFGPALLRASITWGVGNQKTFLDSRGDDIRQSVSGRDDLPLDAETERVALATGAMHEAGNLVMLRMPVAEAKTEVSRLKRVAALCKRLLEGWIGKHRGVLSAPDRALLNHAATQVRDLLRDGALTSLDTPEGTVPLTDIGWYDDHFVYLTGPTIAGIAQAADAGLDRLFDLLEGQDLLKPGGERGYQYKLPSRVPGRPRAYRLSRAILRFAPVG
jgi:hypothetical protein